MTDNNKRSRKSKLVVRNYVDNEETENTILQTVHQPKSAQSQYVPPPPPPSRVLDHTYARPRIYSPSSALHLSVKVEVEELDESTNYDTTSNATQKSIQTFQIDVDKIYKISDRINWLSTNLADKYLSIEMKNIWGRALKPKDDNDPYNVMIQKALHQWAKAMMYVANISCRESPLFYQCFMCKLAWWYLAPFKDHINTHNLTELKVYHQKNGHESHIVANTVIMQIVIYIPCEGNCYRCGNPYGFHVKREEFYKCKNCNKTLETCSMIQEHDMECVSLPLLPRKIYLCIVCFTYFTTSDELDVHMITAHQVRSDIPQPVMFKTCRVCQKKYHYFPTHMCVKSLLSSPCTFCYRKFQTKTLLLAHCHFMVKDYKCRICGEVLLANCMETEHMLSHTDKYRMLYKCIKYSCPPTMLFPDKNSVKLHKVIYHKQKFDKRRSFYEKVLVPDECVKLNSLQEIEASGSTDVRLQKVSDTHGPKVRDWCEPTPKPNTQTEVKDTHDPEVMDWCEPRSKPYRQTGLQDTYEPEIIDWCQPTPKPNTQTEVQNIQEPTETDSQEDSHDSYSGPMDYAEMLSKVFKVADAVRRPRESAGNMQTQIKIEPADEDFDDLFEIHENMIAPKQEPMKAFEETFQTDSCHDDASQNDSCHDDASQNDSSQNDTSCMETQGGVNIKSEPLDYDIGEAMSQGSDVDNGIFDSGLTTVKTEPKDIEQEMIKLSEVNDYLNGDVVTAEAVLATTKAVKKKAVKKKKTNPKPLKKPSHEIFKFRHLPQSSKSLLKKSFAMNTTDSKKAILGSKHTTKSLKKSRTHDDEPKMKTTKYDEYGIKIRKLYRCAKCGYTQSHKLFRMHQKSFCEMSDEPRDTKYLCTKCDMSFSTLKGYLVHFTKHGYRMLHCPCCNIKFEALKDLLQHFHKHVKLSYVNCWMINDELELTKRQHRCQSCRKLVPPEEFFPHWEAHLKLRVEKIEPEDPAVSTENETSSNKNALQPTSLHLALQQLRAVTRDKECTVCCRTFGRRYDMKRHLIEHLLLDAYTKKDSTPDQMLRCQICLEGSPRAEQYKFHMREHGGLPVYRCDLCDKTFSDSSNFAKHKKIHNMKVLICDLCLKKFHAKKALEKHIKLHMTADPIPCEHCNRTFFFKSQYNKHLQVSHLRPARFRCIVCDISFDSLRLKWDHAWAVHKERKHKADCPICHKEYRKFVDVKKHAREEHQVDLSFYSIKSEGGVVNNVNMFCKVKNKKDKVKAKVSTRTGLAV